MDLTISMNFTVEIEPIYEDNELDYYMIYFIINGRRVNIPDEVYDLVELEHEEIILQLIKEAEKN